jgi:hypothetical protein
LGHSSFWPRTDPSGLPDKQTFLVSIGMSRSGSHDDAGSWQQTHILLPSGSRKYAP